MRRVTLDTNVYISALNFGGQPKRLLDMAIAGNVDVAISDPVLQEMERVLRTKFKCEPDEIRETDTCHPDDDVFASPHHAKFCHGRKLKKPLEK